MTTDTYGVIDRSFSNKETATFTVDTLLKAIKMIEEYKGKPLVSSDFDINLPMPIPAHLKLEKGCYSWE
jgi:hypothetical protein